MKRPWPPPLLLGCGWGCAEVEPEAEARQVPAGHLKDETVKAQEMWRWACNVPLQRIYSK